MKFEDEIKSMHSKMKMAETTEEKMILMGRIKDKMKAAKMSGKKLSNISGFFRAASEKTKAAIRAVEESCKGCGD
jgi:hypothetical protein